MKFTCEKCGESFDTEFQCKKHEYEHWLQDTPAFGERKVHEFVVSMTELPDEFDGKYTFTHDDGSKITENVFPSFHANVQNINKLIGRKVRVICYAEIID